MPLDPRAKRLLDMVALGAPKDGRAMTAEERRRGFASLMALGRGAPAPAEVVPVTVAGSAGPLEARVYTPLHYADVRSPSSSDDGEDPSRCLSSPQGGEGDRAKHGGGAAALKPGLVFFHGGGLVAGDLDTHDGLCRRLAHVGRCRVVSVAYRRPPEHPFPAALQDAVAALHAIAAEAARYGIDPRRIAVGGDSGGATLAILAATAARDRGEPPLKFQLLLCPVLDLSERRPSRIAYGEGYLLDQATMDRDLADYLPPGAEPDDPRVSPIRAERLAGLPPTILHTAEFDPLRDEGAAYAGRLEAAGVPVRTTCHSGMIHHFFALDRLIPQALPALEGIGAEIRTLFAGLPE